MESFKKLYIFAYAPDLKIIIRIKRTECHGVVIYKLTGAAPAMYVFQWGCPGQVHWIPTPDGDGTFWGWGTGHREGIS